MLHPLLIAPLLGPAFGPQLNPARFVRSIAFRARNTPDFFHLPDPTPPPPDKTNTQQIWMGESASSAILAVGPEIDIHSLDEQDDIPATVIEQGASPAVQS